MRLLKTKEILDDMNCKDCPVSFWCTSDDGGRMLCMIALELIEYAEECL